MLPSSSHVSYNICVHTQTCDMNKFNFRTLHVWAFCLYVCLQATCVPVDLLTLEARRPGSLEL